MAKKTKQSSGGTSFFGVTINTTVSKLRKLFGHIDTKSGDDKCRHDFTVQTDAGEVFTIYDWKEYRRFGLNETIEFHIGGHSEIVTKVAKQELEKMLAKIKD